MGKAKDLSEFPRNDEGKYLYEGRWVAAEQIERRRQKNRKYHQKYKEKERARKKKYYHDNKEWLNPLSYKMKKEGKWKMKKASPEKSSEYTTRYYYKNREKILKELKEYRDERREEINRCAREQRRRKDPTVGLSKAIRDLECGRIEITEFIRRFGEAIIRIDELSSKKGKS